ISITRALSFTSNTVIRICIVPDIRGSPPSAAVRTSDISSFFSLSKGFCKTISTFFVPSA
uniref:Uncharacterized protein n=1 Tax=Nothobranchius furzeri TaxID=105023 RepID=A0A8C6NHC8_NOTFU